MKHWLFNYSSRYFQGDIIAGLTVAVMLIPQAMSYAMLAGLPPVIGLYASIIPLIVYALLGTSRQLAVGPVAMVALLVSAGVGTLAEPGSSQYISLTVTLALMVGIIQLVMGASRMGFLTNFLSHPVISGFSSAAALIIGFSQLKHMLGFPLPRTHHIHKMIGAAIEGSERIQPETLIIGTVAFIVIIALKKAHPMIPGALVAVAVSSVIVYFFRLDQIGVAIVGKVPAGLPPFEAPAMDLNKVGSLLPMAVTISFVGFIESIAVAKKIASEKKYEISPNRELVALGLANIFGSFFKAMPVTGGFSRTAGNNQAGANTALSSLITALVVAVSLMFFTPLFYYLPKSVLAAIIMAAVLGLVDVKEVTHLWKVKKEDLLLLIITFAATLILGVKQGILVGAACSMFWFVYKTTRPHYAILGKLSDTDDYLNIKRHQTELFENILVIRFDAQFYYGNVSFLKEKLKEARLNMKNEPKIIIIEAAGVNNLDSSADQALHELWLELKSKNIELFFAHVKGPVMDVMKLSGLANDLGENHFFPNIHKAVAAAEKLVRNQEKTS